MPSYTKHIDPSAFTPSDSTEIYCLANASTLIHSHSTNILIDPLLEGFDMKGLIEFPITSKEIKDIDVVLLTYIDNEWHITFDGAVKFTNVYPNARLLCIHRDV